MKFLPDICHCKGWKEGSFVCETVWFFSWVNTHLFDLKFDAFCPKFSGDSWVEFQEKTIPGEFFRNFVQTEAIIYQNLWNFGLISAISFWVRIALQKFHTSTLVCCLHPGREPCPSTNHKKKIRGRKAMTFCFRKTIFFHSRCGTYYALLLGYFGMKFLSDIRHGVYWVLGDVWAPDSSHKISNKFFIRHCQGWKEGSFVCETVWFFSWMNTHPFDLKFVAFYPKFSGDSWVEFQEKTIPGEFIRNFVQTKTTCNLLHATWNLIHATCDLQPASWNLLPATCNLLPVTCHLLPATYNLQHATCYLLHATSHLPPATC